MQRYSVQLKVLDLGQVVAELVMPPAFLYPYHPGGAPQHCPSQLTQCFRWQGAEPALPLSCPQDQLISSMLPRLALLCCPSKVYGLFSQVLQPTKHKVCSPTLMTPE